MKRAPDLASLTPTQGLPGCSAERYVIAVKGGPWSRKLCQIICTAKDGSIYVAFPYASLAPGTLGVMTMKSGMRYPATLNVGHDFPATTHVVKYTHHASGRANFSLDGKVYTRVHRQAVPLSQADGHLFTVMLQGLDRFDTLAHQETSTKKRAFVRFPLPTAPFEALKLIGRFYSRQALAKVPVFAESRFGSVAVRNPDGQFVPGALLRTAFGPLDDPCWLLMTLEPIPRINHQEPTFLTFIGGFDPPAIALDHSVDSSCLTFFYPFRGDLSSRVRLAGSIDFAGPRTVG